MCPAPPALLSPCHGAPSPGYNLQGGAQALPRLPSSLSVSCRLFPIILPTLQLPCRPLPLLLPADALMQPSQCFPKSLAWARLSVGLGTQSRWLRVWKGFPPKSSYEAEASLSILIIFVREHSPRVQGPEGQAGQRATCSCGGGVAKATERVCMCYSIS